MRWPPSFRSDRRRPRPRYARAFTHLGAALYPRPRQRRLDGDRSRRIVDPIAATILARRAPSAAHSPEWWALISRSCARGRPLSSWGGTTIALGHSVPKTAWSVPASACSSVRRVSTSPSRTWFQPHRHRDRFCSHGPPTTRKPASIRNQRQPGTRTGIASARRHLTVPEARSRAPRASAPPPLPSIAARAHAGRVTRARALLHARILRGETAFARGRMGTRSDPF